MSRGASTLPAASVAARSRSSAGHGRSGFTWSIVTGETPPQSSMPAASSGARSSLRFGGACRWTSSGSTRRAAAIDQRNSSGGHGVGLVHRRAQLGQEVLDDHFLHVTVRSWLARDRVERVDALGARLADADEDAGGERHPRRGPAASSVASRRSGVLSGAP